MHKINIPIHSLVGQLKVYFSSCSLGIDELEQRLAALRNPCSSEMDQFVFVGTATGMVVGGEEETDGNGELQLNAKVSLILLII